MFIVKGYVKITVLVLSALLFIGSPCFAQETSAPTVLESKTFAGKVDSVSVPDSTKDTRLELVVTGDRGETMTFVITPGIFVATSEGKIVISKNIKAGDKVLVEYTTNNVGLNRAVMITVEK